MAVKRQLNGRKEGVCVCLPLKSGHQCGSVDVCGDERVYDIQCMQRISNCQPVGILTEKRYTTPTISLYHTLRYKTVL